MAVYRVACMSEKNVPLKGIRVEAVSLTNFPTISETGTTSDDGVVTFNGIVGPHWFRPLELRVSGGVGERTWTGRVDVQIVGSLGEGMNVDYVVDPDNMGTHLTLASAVAAAIATDADKTIWLCKSVTENDISINGLHSAATLTIASHSRHTVRISAGANNDIFKQTDAGGEGSGGLRFRNIGFYVQTSTNAIFLNGDTGGGMSEIRNLIFESCMFNEVTGGGYLMRGVGALAAMGNTRLTVRDCEGSIASFFYNTSTPPDTLFAWNNDLTLNQWWGLSTTGINAADDSYVEGGRYIVTAAQVIALFGNNDGWTFKNLIVRSACSGAHFITSGASTNVKGITFENITFIAGANDTDFADFRSPAGGSAGQNLFVHGIHGIYESGVTPSGTFLTVDTDNVNPYVSDIWAPDWPTVYTGPTITPAVPPVIDHGDLDGLSSDDDHDAYFFLAGRSSGQSAVGGTAAGEDLTLESTSHGTKGAVQIVSGSTFEVNDVNFAFAIVSSKPRITVDTNDYFEYDRATDELRVPGDTLVLPASGTHGFRKDGTGITQIVSWEYEATTDDVAMRFFRTTSTSGAVEYTIFKGDGTANKVFSVRSDLDQIQIGAGPKMVINTSAGTITEIGNDGNFQIGRDAGAPFIQFAAGDKLKYTQGTNQWTFEIGAGSSVLTVNSSGVLIPSSNYVQWGGDVQLSRGASNRLDLATGDHFYIVSGGLGVGVVNTNAGRIAIGDASYYASLLAGNPLLNVDANDYTLYDRAGNVYSWQIGGAIFMRGTATQFHPLYSVNTGFYLGGDGATSNLYFDGANDVIQYARAANLFNFISGGAVKTAITLAGQLQVPVVGSGAGVLIGGDVQLYRSAADILYIPDSVTITGVLSRARKPIVAKAEAYTLTLDDDVVIADAVGAAFTVTLPTAVGIPGKVYWIKKIDATANAVTIDGDGAETIDGAATAVICCQYEAITVVSDGTEWWVI